MTNIHHLLQSPDSFRNHKVLKNGSALVLRLDTEEGRVMCKIAHANNALLEREASRIQLLKARYPILGAHMPSVLGQGVIGSGLHRDKTYYLQEFIDGRSLAAWLQLEETSADAAQKTISSVVSVLLDMLDEHEFDTSLDGRSGVWLREYLSEAYNRLLSLEHIGYLNSLEEIVINDRSCRSLAKCLEDIFASNTYLRLNDGPSTISVLGHWNFHSENVILTENGNAGGFMVVDPDVKIEVSDPMFGLARLFYSFPHDTGDTRHFRIDTDVLLPNADTSNRFAVEFTWPQTVIEKYTPLYTGITDSGVYDPGGLDERLNDPLLAARLDLSFMLCLLRGVAINHNTEFWVLDDSLRTFQNKGVYLFLTAVDFANKVAERFRSAG